MEDSSGAAAGVAVYTIDSAPAVALLLLAAAVAASVVAAAAEVVAVAAAAVAAVSAFTRRVWIRERQALLAARWVVSASQPHTPTHCCVKSSKLSHSGKGSPNRALYHHRFQNSSGWCLRSAVRSNIASPPLLPPPLLPLQ